MGAYEYYIAHFGIKGQKWGDRRYQNPDGTYTEEGKARRRSSDGKSEYDSGSKKWKSKEARHLSDDELNRRNSRLQREKQYIDMTQPAIKKETKAILKKIFVMTAVGVAAGVATSHYKSLAASGEEWLNLVKVKGFMNHVARARGAAWLL